MCEEILKRNRNVLEQQTEPEGTQKHLGLYNSIKRLKHFYGRCASITVESEIDEMTSFVISFPYDLEEIE